MNRILVTATGIALSVALSSAGVSALAQNAAPAAKAGGARPAGAPTKAAHPKAVPRATNQTSTWADARVCLEFPTNAQIIRCSEKYRFMKAPA